MVDKNELRVEATETREDATETRKLLSDRELDTVTGGINPQPLPPRHGSIVYQ